MDATKSAQAHAGPVEQHRCHAHSKRSGERCRRLAIPGGTVCIMHGGAAPQVARAARRRLVYAGATTAVAQTQATHPELLPGGWAEPAANLSKDTIEEARRLRRARARKPRWWAAADAHERRELWRAVAAEVGARLAAADLSSRYESG